MRKLFSCTMVAFLALFVGACDETPTTPEASSLAQNTSLSKSTVGSNAGSLGKITLDTEVSSWDIGTAIPNGKFIVAENQGVQLGLRALERKEGLLGVTGDNGDRVAVYEANTGCEHDCVDKDDNERNWGTWNYDFHVDLSNAKNRHEGKTLSDYRLVLEQDFTEQSLFGVLGSDPVQLPLDAEPPIGSGVCSNDSFDADNLCQQSWNPGFGNDDFDPDAEGTYNLRLVLTPETFNAQPLAVAIRVNVSD